MASAPHEVTSVLPLVSSTASWGGEDDVALCASATSTIRSVYSERVKALLTVSAKDMLRAVPLGRALRSFGHIWTCSKGTEDDYEQSAPVEHIDHFLSHAWATPWLRKVLALMIYYNFLPGLIVASSAALSTFALYASGVLAWGSIEEAYFMVGVAVWMTTLFFFHEIYCLFGSRFQATVFLDKACIHQTDDELKAQGIKSLPAFLKQSRSMVILYSEAYLTRLWTVYELATYVLLKPKGDMEILPVDIPLKLLAGLIVVSFTPRSSFYQLWWLVEIVGFLLEAELCYWLASMLRRIYDAFAEFDIRKTQCYFEPDRILVERNVDAYMKHMGHVSPNEGVSDAMLAFNSLVRETVPKRIQASLGSIGIPFRVAILVDIPGIVQVFDLMKSVYWTGDVATADTVDLLLTMVHWVLVGPIALAAGVRVADAFVRREGCGARAVASIATFLTLFAVEWALAVPLFLLAFAAQNHPVAGLLGLLAFCCLLLLSIFAIYGLPRIFLTISGRTDAAEEGAVVEEKALPATAAPVSKRTLVRLDSSESQESFN